MSQFSVFSSTSIQCLLVLPLYHHLPSCHHLPLILVRCECIPWTSKKQSGKKLSPPGFKPRSPGVICATRVKKIKATHASFLSSSFALNNYDTYLIQVNNYGI